MSNIIVRRANTTLPEEWRAALATLPPAEAQRIESLYVKGQTSPLPPEKETGPFLLFMLGNSISDVAIQSGTPRDVIYLTYLHYNWEAKRAELAKLGQEVVIAQLQKQVVNHLLVATQMLVMKQIGEVMSGQLDPEKCPLIPRSLHGLSTLMQMVSDANKLVAAQEANKTPNIVVNAQNAQINQNQVTAIEPAKSPEEEKLAKLRKMAEEQ